MYMHGFDTCIHVFRLFRVIVRYYIYIYISFFRPDIVWHFSDYFYNWHVQNYIHPYSKTMYIYSMFCVVPVCTRTASKITRK